LAERFGEASKNKQPSAAKMDRMVVAHAKLLRSALSFVSARARRTPSQKRMDDRTMAHHSWQIDSGAPSPQDDDKIKAVSFNVGS
jgi:hypothetical protein